MTATAKKAPDHGAELLTNMRQLVDRHERLAELIEAKIRSMRSCDTAGMNALAAEERALVRGIGELESRRRVLTDRIVRSYGISSARGRRLTVQQLSEKLSAEHRPGVLQAAERLRELTSRIARRNRLAGEIGRHMLKHMDRMLTAMTAARHSGCAYSPAGRAGGSAPQRLFETVG